MCTAATTCPQLTVRAIIMGSFLGFLLAFTNLYLGLKTGWAVGVAITACILAYLFWNGFLRVGLAKTPMTILETNCMQSTASSAGYSTGGTMVSAIAALLMLSATADNPGGHHLSWPVLGAWTLFLAALGTVMAIPMKRNMINREKLKFPTGTAAALTLQSLYSEGSDAINKARALMYSALLGASVPLLIELNLMSDKVAGKFSKPIFQASSAIFDFLPARGTHLVDGQQVINKPSDWTLVLDHNPVMVAAGMIVGLRVTAYMMLSGLALAYVLGPEAYDYVWQGPEGAVRAATSPGTAWREIGIWFGVLIMVSSGRTDLSSRTDRRVETRDGLVRVFCCRVRRVHRLRRVY